MAQAVRLLPIPYTLHRTPYTIHHTPFPPLHGEVGWDFYRTRYKTEGLPNHYRRITEG